MFYFVREILPVIIAISLVSFTSSFASPKLGMFASSLITVGYIAFAILAAVGGVPGSDKFLILGLFVYPFISWTCFFIGRHFRRNRNA